MSGEAAKERATTAYVRVPSKYLLRSEFPNQETGRPIKRQNDDTEKHVFHDSEVRSCTHCFDLAAAAAKRSNESNTELPRRRVRFEDAGTHHPACSEAPSVARRRHRP